MGQNNTDSTSVTNKINRVRGAFYAPWILGVVGITCSSTIEVWASSMNRAMAHRFKQISLASLMMSVCLLFGNRSYLESGFYLKYKSGRDIFERISELAVDIELGIKDAVWNVQKHSERRVE